MKTRENRSQESGVRSQKQVHNPESTVQSPQSTNMEHGTRNTSPTLSRARAFTLIELLVVIAVISLLAAMTVPITGAVKRNRMRAAARTEMEQIATAIESYKAKLGHYPPDNVDKNNLVNPRINQLYFELIGTTNDGTYYATRDGGARIRDSVADFSAFLGPATTVNGIVNATKRLASDEARASSSFLTGLKPAQIGEVTGQGGDTLKILICSVPAPVDPNNLYPVPGRPGLNPWRYNSSNPTNNPNSYDLWIDLVISGKTNRICNWSKEPLTVGTP